MLRRPLVILPGAVFLLLPIQPGADCTEQEGCPSLFSNNPVDREIFVLLVVFDRLVGGRSEVAIHIYDRKATPLVQHQLKMLYYRGPLSGADPNLSTGNLRLT